MTLIVLSIVLPVASLMTGCFNFGNNNNNNNPPPNNSLVGRWQPNGGNTRENGIIINTSTPNQVRDLLGNSIQFHQDGTLTQLHPQAGIVHSRWRLDQGSIINYQGQTSFVMADSFTVAGNTLTMVLESDFMGNLQRTEIWLTRMP